VTGEYALQARTNLESVAKQFQPSPDRAARLEAVHWEPEVSSRWEHASHDFAAIPDPKIDPWRPAVIARCLDDIARAVEQTSSIAGDINLRTSSR